MDTKHFSDPVFDVRFWTRVDRIGPCWLWTASKTKAGYGQVSHSGTPKTVHRLVFELYSGDIPQGMFVLHHCDVRHCCNPDHLYLGTAADNSADMVARGRSVKGRKTPLSGVHGERHGMAKITDAEVAYLRHRYAAGGITQEALAHELGISGAHVCAIIKRRYRKKDVSALSP